MQPMKRGDRRVMPQRPQALRQLGGLRAIAGLRKVPTARCYRRGHSSLAASLLHPWCIRMQCMPRGDNNAKLGPSQKDELARRYTTRLPDGTWEGAKSLAREFGVSVPTVYRHLRLRGIEIRSAAESHAGGKRCKPVKNLPPGVTHTSSAPAGLVLLLPGGPVCKCGCEESVAWNRRKNRWNAYVDGHYRRAARYKDEGWLRAEYFGKQRTIGEIAQECGVNRTSVQKAMRSFGIAPRDASAAHVGRQVGELNPAWKGGVAEWPYSSDWKVLARQIRDRDKWTCQDCGEQRVRWGAALHVHHIDEDKLNNDPGNLISLCATCHRRRHGARKLAPVEATPAA